MATLAGQLVAKPCISALYWAVILATSTAGTANSDYMDRTLGLGYATGSAILMTILGAWWMSEKSLSVTDVQSRRAEPSCSTGLPS